jgi:hypothetical protein
MSWLALVMVTLFGIFCNSDKTVLLGLTLL